MSLYFSYWFSYLTCYSNHENYFFLLRTNEGFGLDKWDETLSKNKVTRKKMTEFKFKLNNKFKYLLLKKAHKEIKIKEE